jgi:hypothetical protein
MGTNLSDRKEYDIVEFVISFRMDSISPWHIQKFQKDAEEDFNELGINGDRMRGRFDFYITVYGKSAAEVKMKFEARGAEVREKRRK